MENQAGAWTGLVGPWVALDLEVPAEVASLHPSVVEVPGVMLQLKEVLRCPNGCYDLVF